jgi:hypothetical protein
MGRVVIVPGLARRPVRQDRHAPSWQEPFAGSGERRRDRHRLRLVFGTGMSDHDTANASSKL